MADGPPWLATAIALRADGWTLEAIGGRVGLTRERVRQVLAEYPEPLPPCPWVTAQSVCPIVSREPLKDWIERGWVRRHPEGRLVHEGDVVATAERLMARRCDYPGCEEPIGRIASDARFCPGCSIEVRRYDYPVLDEEGRRRAAAAKERWRQQNPERSREIQRHARQAFAARQRAAQG